MSQEVLIKKYPNRCLYDTSRSEYVTLDQVRAMVVAEVPIKVLEQKNR
jgi:polyhydroxyalkanoate synthesis regulator protein